MLVKYTIVFSLVIDITKELRNCRADNKAAKIKEVNEEEKLTRVVPSKKMVACWIDQAKKLDPVVTY